MHKFCKYGDVFHITQMPYVENFRFLHICHVEISEMSPHDNFFSTNMIRDIREKYQLWVKLVVVVFN